MKKQEPVSHIMTKHVHTAQLEDKLLDIYELVRKHHIRHVPIVHGKQLVGIISKTDLFDMLNIGQVMSHKPRVVKSNDTIKTVAEILSNEEFHALPVVDEKDDSVLVGIVTTTDVIKYLLEQY